MRSCCHENIQQNGARTNGVSLLPVQMHREQQMGSLRKKETLMDDAVGKKCSVRCRLTATTKNLENTITLLAHYGNNKYRKRPKNTPEGKH